MMRAVQPFGVVPKIVPMIEPVLGAAFKRIAQPQPGVTALAGLGKVTQKCRSSRVAITPFRCGMFRLFSMACQHAPGPFAGDRAIEFWLGSEPNE